MGNKCQESECYIVVKSKCFEKILPLPGHVTHIYALEIEECQQPHVGAL